MEMEYLPPKGDDKEYQIIIISSNQEAMFTKKFLMKTIGVSVNKSFIALSLNDNMVFVYPRHLSDVRDIIYDILNNPNIIKLISKPIYELQILLGDGDRLDGENIEEGGKKSTVGYGGYYEIKNFKNISRHLCENGYYKLIPEMKRKLIELGTIESLENKAAKIALTIMSYKNIVERGSEKQHRGEKERHIIYNKKRDCYLLYLTAYNDVLSKYGPMKFIDLTTKVRYYPYLCKTKLNPAMALENLIKAGALKSDKISALISIPDQL